MYEGSTTVETLSQGHFFQYIHDFEILNNEDVYFCGERYEWDGNYNTVLKGVFIGHFTMTDFRNTPQGGFLNIDTIPLLNIIGLIHTKKMDVFSDNIGVIHVVVTANAPNGSYIVDAYTSGGGSWDVVTTPGVSQSETYDDVAITENFVIVSARSVSKSPGSILVFDKPTSGASVFPPPMVSFTRVTLPYSVDGEILLEACENDVFVSACHSAGDSAIYISGFDGTTHLSTIGMPLNNSLSPSSQLKDISYSPYMQDLEILQYSLFGYDTASIVYHIRPNVLVDPNPVVYGNYYKCQTLCSIVNKRYLNGYTFASGHPFMPCYNEPNNNYHVLRKYVLLQGSFGNCTKKRESAIWIYEKNPSVSDDGFYRSPHTKSEGAWPWVKSKGDVDIICN